MLKLKKLGPNQVEVTDGTLTVLFSYQTPVACQLAGVGFARTDKQWSNTTNCHVDAFVGEADCSIVTQGTLDALRFAPIGAKVGVR